MRTIQNNATEWLFMAWQTLVSPTQTPYTRRKGNNILVPPQNFMTPIPTSKWDTILEECMILWGKCE